MIYMNKDQKLVTKKCKDVDFVFVYEVKNRELQGISLIGYELAKRGYTVGYVNTWYGLHNDILKYRAKVAVVFEAYNSDVINFSTDMIDHCEHVFNMQWEQILCDVCYEDGCIYLLKGNASKVFHASWGVANYKHLTEVCNIPADKVKIVGHVGLDPARDRFKGFYKDKQEICREFKFGESKEIALFISTFANHVNKSVEFQNFAKNSQTTILDWIIRYAKENSNVQVIYRPHPAEITDRNIVDKLESVENIRVISQYSIQQWVAVADVILNWWSTSMGDVAVANKSSVLLRPYEIPAEYEYHLFKGAKMARTYEEMIEQIKAKESPVTKEKLQEFYYFDDRMVYEKIADELEKIYAIEEPTYLYDNKKKRKLKEYKFILYARERYGYMKSYIAKKLGRKNSFDEIHYHFTMMKNYNVSEKEIVKIMNRFRSLM